MELPGGASEDYKEMPKVTVFIPARNHEHYVEKAVKSVLVQNFVNWGLIMNNSSIWGTLNFMLDKLEEEHYCTDTAVVLYINNPLRKSLHIEKAVDSMLILGSDSVISVKESNIL